MKVYRNLDTLPPFLNAVITIGTFDGVHLGHQKIIQQVLAESEASGGESVLITFNPHPRKIVQPEKSLMQLTTMDERIELLKQQGINNMVIVPFTKEFSQQTALQYIHHFLVEKFHPSKIIIGYDHKFGNNREGDFRLLEQHASEFNYSVKEIDEELIQDAIISSTKIREALLQGNVKLAHSYLGYDYFFKGVVIEGNKLGRTIGYPTANLQMENPDKLVPGNGVYAVTCQLEGETRMLNGMMNIGTRPTVDGLNLMIEVNIFDFDEEIYGRHLKVWLKHYLRSEVKFSGIDALKEQLNKDKEESVRLLTN
ncbi:MAG: bifunctional riboflavin kinase/FAD synthetase [Chitinophagaceae bacterium]|nr:bifunctional riboflavin kinase/FAD synthetase [Chitinophagaceae bacterium]